MAKYCLYLSTNDVMLARLPELSGRILRCHCPDDLECHGDIIKEAFNELILGEGSALSERLRALHLHARSKTGVQERPSNARGKPAAEGQDRPPRARGKGHAAGGAAAGRTHSCCARGKGRAAGGEGRATNNTQKRASRDAARGS